MLRLLAPIAVSLAAVAHPGIAPETRHPLPNGDFVSGAAQWSASGAIFAPAADLERPTHLVAQVAGQASLTQVLAIGGGFDVAGRPGLGQSGVKLEAQAWFKLDAGHAGDAVLELVSREAAGEVVLARSDSLLNAPRGRWIPVRTRPIAPHDARVRPASLSLELRVACQGAGVVRVDDARIGHHEREQWPLVDAGFEGQGGWTLFGNAARATNHETYQGARWLALVGTGRAAATQSIALGASERAPRAGDKPQAGVWLRIDPAAQLPAAPDPRVRIDLHVRAASGSVPDHMGTLLAQASLLPVASQRGRWIWLATDRATASNVGFDHERVVVDVRKQVRGAVQLDEVQLGEAGAAHGMSRRHAMASYVGRYRSFRYPQAAPVANDLAARWGTWAWTSPPFCAPTMWTLSHSPDNLRTNGRRDLAISTLRGSDWLPIAGSYDSRDPALLSWHARLIAATGFDSVLYTFDGHRLAQHEVSIGREPVNLQALRALYAACEANGGDLKIGLMIEPKVHMLGWVPGIGGFAARVQAIEDDLVAMLAEFGPRRATLRRDGGVVVHAFHNAICSNDGSGCLSDGDWAALVARAEQRSGERVHLVADDVPQGGAAFRSTARWSLVTQDILQHRTWSDFVSGQSSRTSADALEGFCDAIHDASRQWAAQDDESRGSIGIAWPGFDDSGVAGWSGPNIPGVDGAAVCVRVMGDCGGDPLGTTWRSATRGARDWTLVATFNDWNEWTQLEPRWNQAYAQAAAGDQEPSAAARAAVLGRIEAMQGHLAVWKEALLDPDEPHRATKDYL
ncbi:MAG: hypothetical protein RL112_2898, partial [Planctomycetota bacterium]